MTQQLALQLDLREDTKFTNFYIGKNQVLVNTLLEVARGRGEQFVYIWGGHGVGRTHLLQAACHVANQLKLAPIYLPLARFADFKPEILEDLDALHLVCIDDVDAIAGSPAWEEAFFHFYNRMREANKRLIVAGGLPPAQLGIALPDLVSRLSWGAVFHIQELNDDEKVQALLWRADERGLKLSDQVVRYLINHCHRNMADLFSTLDRLDKASLEAKRKITIPFLKAVL